MKHITLQLWHVGDGNLLGIGKPIERAQQIAEGVAQFAILIGNTLQDFIPDAVILGMDECGADRLAFESWIGSFSTSMPTVQVPLGNRS
jgi:hypothetical protein